MYLCLKFAFLPLRRDDLSYVLNAGDGTKHHDCSELVVASDVSARIDR